MVVDKAKFEEIRAKLKAREEFIRESWVKAMELRLYQNEITKCHLAEGVNHYESCREYSERYLRMMKTNRVRGYKNIEI